MPVPYEDPTVPWVRPEPPDIFIVNDEDPLLTELLERLLTENERFIYSS